MTALTPKHRPGAWASSPVRIPGLGRSRNLVIVRAGTSSLHRQWLQDGHDESGSRGFDLLVAAYDPCVERLDRDGAGHVLLPGSKIAGLAELFRSYPDLLEWYEYIALLDDDLLVSRQAIARLFDVGRMYSLDLFQPALSWDSYFSYAATLEMRSYRLRFTNTVEMMCPVFSSTHLKRALPLFGLGYETGIDLVWSRLTNEPWLRYAIVDEVVIKHTRPVGTTKTAQGFGADESYDAKAADLLDRFGASFRGFVCYAAVGRDGLTFHGRTAIALRSVKTLAAVRCTPIDSGLFVRLSTDFTRHCLYRPLNLGRIDLYQIDAVHPAADLDCALV